MFLLKKIVVENHQNTVLDVTFLDNQQKEQEQPFSTLILGENGTGKSFLLKTIADIFIFPPKVKRGTSSNVRMDWSANTSFTYANRSNCRIYSERMVFQCHNICYWKPTN